MFFLRKVSVLSLLLVVLLLAAGCSFSTAGDVTPPPGAEQSLPTTATESLSQAETSLEESDSVATTPSDSATNESGAGPLLIDSGPLTIRGTVLHQTGGDVPAGLEVFLQGYAQMEVVTAQTTVIDEDGNFSFVLLEPVQSKIFIASLEYNSVVFNSGMVYLDELQDGSVTSLTIPVYDNTPDTSLLLADRVHVFFSFLSAEQMQVVVYLLISNADNRVVAGETINDPTLFYTLPADAENLQFETDAANFVETENGFGDLAVIYPGEQQYELLFAYEIPYNRKRSLNMVFPLSVASGTVIVPEGVKVTSAQLSEAGEREMEMGLMKLYNIAELEAGTELEMELQGFPNTVSYNSENNWVGLAIGVGIFALVTISAGFWLHRKNQRVVSSKHEPAGQEVPGTQDDLLDAIIQLDTAYENGEVSEKEYLSRRAHLKEKLKEIRTESGE